MNVAREEPRLCWKLKAILILIFLCPSLSPAQWVSQNYGNRRIRAIQFFTSGNGYLVGENGLTLRLSNWGKSFEAITNLPFQPEFLGDLCFLNQDSGWVVGSDGAVFKTSNGGASWVNHDRGNTFFLACHAFTLSVLEYVWVGGLGNTIFCTTRGGALWQRCDTNLSGTVYDLFFTRARQGYAVTNDGIYSQPPGGAWSRVFPSNTILQGFSQSSENVAWVAGYNGAILRTAALPGGWQSVKPQNFTTDLYSIFALSDNEAYAVGANGTVAHTSDVGSHWEISNLGNKFFEEVFALDADNIWIVGDGGANFYSEGTVAFGAEPFSLNEPVEVDTTREITFATEFNSRIDLHFSSTVDTNWVAILDAQNLAAGAGKFSWKIPDSPSTTCRLRIRSTKKPRVQTISNVFEIFKKSLAIEAPGGGEQLDGNSRFAIRWTHENLGKVNLRLQIKQNPDSVVIADNIPAANFEFDWLVPPGINSNECRVRIFEADRSPLAVSNLFAITFDPDVPVVAVDTSAIRAQKGQDLIITATISDDTTTLDSLFYRRGGDTSYRIKSLAAIGNDIYQATIFAREGDDFVIDERGLEFYIKAVDVSPQANTGRFGAPTKPFFIPVQINSVQHGILNSNPGEDIYQMIAIPYKLEDAIIGKVLQDDLGPYDPHQWRLWLWRSEAQSYGEYNKAEIGAFTQGKSFWLATVKDKFFSDAGQSYKPENVELDLQPGWNQIGHPFAFPVRTQEVFNASADTVGLSSFYGYDGSFKPADQLMPGKGYFIKNMNTSARTITIPPLAAKNSSSLALPSPRQDEEWKIRLHAHAGRHVDDYNLAGINKVSLAEWDARDQPEPPAAPGKYLSLYFPHPDWRVYPDRYAADFRPAFDEGEIWELAIATNLTSAAVEIKCEGLETVPEEFAVYLLDEQLLVTQDLRKNPVYTVAAHSRTPKNSLRLVVGKPEFFEHRHLPLNQIPAAYELSQNFPNPFNPATAMRLGLPAAGNVTLKIYDTLGREIRTLLRNAAKSPGFHIAVWDGKDESGVAVASGVYFYRLTVDGFSQIRKMILVQ